MSAEKGDLVAFDGGGVVKHVGVVLADDVGIVGRDHFISRALLDTMLKNFRDQPAVRLLDHPRPELPRYFPTYPGNRELFEKCGMPKWKWDTASGPDKHVMVQVRHLPRTVEFMILDDPAAAKLLDHIEDRRHHLEIEWLGYDPALDLR